MVIARNVHQMHLERFTRDLSAFVNLLLTRFLTGPPLLILQPLAEHMCACPCHCAALTAGIMLVLFTRHVLDLTQVNYSVNSWWITEWIPLTSLTFLGAPKNFKNICNQSLNQSAQIVWKEPWLLSGVSLSVQSGSAVCLFIAHSNPVEEAGSPTPDQWETEAQRELICLRNRMIHAIAD